MIELGKVQELTVVKKVDFGVYLGEKMDAGQEERVLLPGKKVPAGTKEGDRFQVFIYKDSSDRLIATTDRPKAAVGELAVMKVAQVTRIGAFLDWGLEKDLLLPYKEQTERVEKGDRCLVGLYIDKSERLCATMKIYPMLRTDSPYKKDDMVTGTVYGRNRDYGVYVAVDDQFSAMIPKREVYGKLQNGQQIEARVMAVKADGKLDLSVRGKIPQQMDKDARLLLERMKERGGNLPFTDKASPEQIRQEFDMSKAAFKRAVGRLLKENKIEIGGTEIRRQ